MKKFEMPVVVLNEMTMNESIASDCCFKQVTEGYVTTKTVLNGGTIGSYVTYPLKASVVDFYGSRSALPTYHYKVYVPINNFTSAPTPTPVVGSINQAGWTSDANAVKSYDVLTFSTDASGNLDQVITVGDGAVANLTGVYIKQNGGACDHFNSDCPFVTKTTMSDAHIGSTMKHLFGGTDWQNPHKAQQYNS